jgi:hypothetical protein
MFVCEVVTRQRLYILAYLAVVVHQLVYMLQYCEEMPESGNRGVTY